jgi:ankyrin repeat protein
MIRILISLSLIFILAISPLHAEQPGYDKKQANEALEAILSGNLTHVMKLIEAGLPATAKGDYDMPLLYTAAQEGKGEIVRFLIEQGADPNEAVLYGQSAMHAALDHPSILKGMVELGGKANLTDKKGETLLMSAATSSRPEAIRVLLELKADPKLKDQKGRNALFYAMSNKRSYVDEIFVMLVKHGAQTDMVDNEGNTLLMEAVRWGQDNLLKSFDLDDQSLWAKNNKGESVLDMLAGGGKSRQRVADMLLARNPPPQLLQQALGATLKSGEYWMTEKMVNAGASIKDAQLLFLALRGGSWDALRQLLAAGLDPNVRSTETDKTPLQTALTSRNTELVRLLLQYGADISTVSADDLSYSGVLSGEEREKELAILLIAAGLSPDLELYGEKLKDYLKDRGQDDLAALFGHTAQEGCTGIQAPLADEQLLAKRSHFIGVWQRQGEDNVQLTLAADGQAQRELEFFGIQQVERGTWELKKSHLVLHLTNKGKLRSQRLGVHCLGNEKMITGNGSEAMHYAKTTQEAVIPEAASAKNDEGLGPIRDELSEQQAVKLLARIGCYSKGYTSDEERTAALMAYVKPSGIEDQKTLFKKLGPYMEDKDFQGNHFMEIMTEMVKCSESM